LGFLKDITVHNIFFISFSSSVCSHIISPFSSFNLFIDFDDENLDKDIDDLEHKISKAYENKAKGAQVRSRGKWMELGEENNSYFLGLEK
jgi:hypothetical protein